MAVASIKNRELYAELHESNPTYGAFSSLLMEFILPIAEDLNPRQILDYGCGKSTLVDELSEALDCEPIRYDPCMEQYNISPDSPVDLVLNTDVLEHVPEVELDSVLADIKKTSSNVIFHIPTTYAAAILPDGSNAHCTVKPSPWWLDKLTEHFPYVEIFRSRTKNEQFYVTWTLSDSSRANLKQIYRTRRRVNSIQKRKHALKNAKRFLFKRYVSDEILRNEIKGKRVAVVGNANSLINHEYGTEIDENDIVIRINRCNIPHVRSHGKKVTWVATEMDIPRNLLTYQTASRLLWLSKRKVSTMPTWISQRNDKTYILQSKYFRKYHARVNKIPSTGFLLLCLLEELGSYDKLNIYGFDFFETNTTSSHITLKNARRDHNYQKEKAYVQQWVCRDTRVSLQQL